MVALARARQMSAYDRDDAAGSVSGQYKMLVNLFDVEAQKAMERINGSGILRPAKIGPEVPGFENQTAQQVPITPSTFGMETLMTYLRQDPGDPLLPTAIQGFVKMHKEYLNTTTTGGGVFSYYFDLPLDGFTSSEQGYGPVYPAFIQGRAAYGLPSLYQQTCDPAALSLGRSLLHFLNHWKAPYNGTSPLPSSSTGAFKDHIYSVVQGVFALIVDAEIRRASNPVDPVAQRELTQANNI